MVVLIALPAVRDRGTIAITQAQRRIAVQYAKRVVGRKQFGGQTQYLPLKVNYAGVMPIIFASAVLSLPPMMLQWFFRGSPWATKLYGELAERRHLVLHPRRHRDLLLLLLLGGDDVPALADRRGPEAQRRLHPRRAPGQADRGFPRLHDDAG